MFKYTTWLAMLLVAGPLAAEETREISGTRIELAELVPSVSGEIGAIDLGRSPPPGGSRLFTRAEIQRQIVAAGFGTVGVTLPDVVRARTPGTTVTGPALAALVRPAVELALPPGVELSTLTVGASLMLSEDATVGTVTLSPIPRRAGSVRVGLSVELMSGGEVAHRLTATAVVKLSTKAARYDIARGGVVRLVLHRKSARIEAEGTALANADIGQVVSFRVTNSNKTLRARIVSEREAIVTEGQ
jgi:Chaperone for flagella basal body P-ring formation